VEDREAELSEHLGELRARLIRSIAYVAAGAVAAWVLYGWIYSFLTRPVRHALHTVHTKMLLTHVAEGFMLKCQVSLLAGLIIAAPFVTREVWLFVRPALTKDERRPVRWVVPLSVLLFAGGVATAYLIFPAAMNWFIGYVPKDAELRPSMSATVVFIVKMLLAFGLVYEMPIFLLLLAKIGIINSRMLKSSWRFAVVAIAVVAAVVTPSADAFSMMAMAVPMVGLYVLSIALVKFVEPKGSG